MLCCAVLCRELLAHPEIFKGQQVLELGSGTGLVGLAAALAGAEQVRSRQADKTGRQAGCQMLCYVSTQTRRLGALGFICLLHHHTQAAEQSKADAKHMHGVA